MRSAENVSFVLFCSYSSQLTTAFQVAVDIFDTGVSLGRRHSSVHQTAGPIEDEPIFICMTRSSLVLLQ